MESFFHNDDKAKTGNTSKFNKLKKLITAKIKRLYLKNIPEESIQDMKPICKLELLLADYFVD